MFSKNGYPNWFFNKALNQFLNLRPSQPNPTSTEEKEKNFILFDVPYLGKVSDRFLKHISRLVFKVGNVKVQPIYRTFKVSNYFNLKSRTPLPLMSNVVYCFSCPCDVGKTYIGMSSRHLAVRAKEHLNLSNNKKSAIKDHLLHCNVCSEIDISLDSSFTVLKKCSSEYDTKIHEAFLIKRHRPFLNKQLYANGCSVLLKIF